MAEDLEALDADEGLEKRRHRHWFDRLMFLCDGVFAIAITFLAADLQAPVNWAGDWSGLWPHLAGELNVYAMSFLVISIYWLAHRRYMAMILNVDAPVTVLTLMMLGLVALIPAATRLISVHSDFPPARLVYGALVVGIGLALAAVWAYASLLARTVSREVNLRQRWFMLFLALVTPPFFLSLAFLIPDASPGEVPLFLAALFLIGWPMRLWVLRRLRTQSA